MNEKEWTKKITSQCKKIGTYRKEYVPVIETLAQILEQRDNTLEQYKEEGCQPVIEVAGSMGQTKPMKNPLLLAWDDLNKSALAVWRELGLTPSGFKKITGDQAQKERRRALWLRR